RRAGGHKCCESGAGGRRCIGQLLEFMVRAHLIRRKASKTVRCFVQPNILNWPSTRDERIKGNIERFQEEEMAGKWSITKGNPLVRFALVLCFSANDVVIDGSAGTYIFVGGPNSRGTRISRIPGAYIGGRLRSPGVEGVAIRVANETSHVRVV